jgi:hypothetical protein
MIVEASATITIDGSGKATVYLGEKLTGRIHAFKYAPGTIAAIADLTITGETSGVPILTKANAGSATVWFYPKVIPNNGSDGSAFTDVATDIFVFTERIKVVVAQGGDLGFTGTITVYVDTRSPY